MLGEGPPRSQWGLCRWPSPPGAIFSHANRGLWLSPGRLQEQGPDPAMLRAGSTAELSNCPLSAQDNSEQGALSQRGPRPPPASRPQYLIAGLHLSSHCPPTPNPDSPCSATGTLVTLSQEGWFGEYNIPGTGHHRSSTNVQEGDPLGEGSRHPHA